MFHLGLGVSILLFGVLIGGVGVASAGVGIGIPMIPLGMYMTYRGWRIYKYAKEQQNGAVINLVPLEPLEQTKRGKIYIGFILILVGIGTSALFIGLPIMAYGSWMIYKELKAKK